MSSRISQNKANWTAKTLFGQSIPKWVTDSLKNLNDFVNTIKGALDFLIGILKALQLFLKGFEDFFISLVMSIFMNFINILTQFFTSGASFIVITPYNSKLATTIDIFETNSDGTPKHINTNVIPSPSPSSKTSALDTLSKIDHSNEGKKNKTMGPVKALGPKEALQDLINSFTDTSDPNRPQWGTKEYAAGYGLLITTGDISGFISLVRLLKTFFDFPDLNVVEDKLTKELNDAKNNAGSDWTDIISTLGQNWSDFKTDLSSLQTTIQSSGHGTLAENQAAFQGLIVSELTGVRHWETLSLQNIPLLNNISKELAKLIDVLITMVKDVDDIIDSIINALIKKIQYLESVLDGIFGAVMTLVSFLNNTGLYSFSIDFGMGGVEYIKNAINSSIPTSPIASIGSSAWSCLFFAGMGTPDFNLLKDWYNSVATMLTGDFTGSENAQNLCLADIYSHQHQSATLPLR